MGLPKCRFHKDEVRSLLKSAQVLIARQLVGNPVSMTTRLWPHLELHADKPRGSRNFRRGPNFRREQLNWELHFKPSRIWELGSIDSRLVTLELCS